MMSSRKNLNYRKATVEEIANHFKNSSRALVHAQRHACKGSDLEQKIEEAYVMFKRQSYLLDGKNFDYDVFSAQEIFEHMSKKNSHDYIRAAKRAMLAGRFDTAAKIAEAEMIKLEHVCKARRDLAEKRILALGLDIDKGDC
jgi:hypothetical protein